MSGYHGFAGWYDLLTENVPYQVRGEYFDGILRRFGVEPGVLLDLACGTGTLSMVMEDLGWDVIGVDSSEEMLTQAMNKKIASGNNILYLCQDMRELDLYGTVDACICALDSLNHVTSPEDVLQIFRRVAAFLEPGGLFVFDVNTPYKHEHILSGQTFIYDYDEVYCSWQNSECHDGIIDITLDLFSLEEDGTYYRETEEFSERAYGQEELTSLLRQAGLECFAVYGDDSLSPPGEETQRAVYVARSRK